eukprot:CAMPEP_0169319096 /NCGR_PEP_ID=MMETSP1017-20121227/7646_1 /TAXON_ID=342587 /ORGANISM="Karlodinium micrum, Strain CCMP2283" /LENGTH=384 /DNA_ID=CAMNT_0009413433 /DNA_START=12 /DNA_END=1166 /DNA_ORIENTATION=+
MESLRQKYAGIDKGQLRTPESETARDFALAESGMHPRNAAYMGEEPKVVNVSMTDLFAQPLVSQRVDEPREEATLHSFYRAQVEPPELDQYQQFSDLQIVDRFKEHIGSHTEVVEEPMSEPSPLEELALWPPSLESLRPLEEVLESEDPNTLPRSPVFETVVAEVSPPRVEQSTSAGAEIRQASRPSPLGQDFQEDSGDSSEKLNRLRSRSDSSKLRARLSGRSLSDSSVIIQESIDNASATATRATWSSETDAYRLEGRRRLTPSGMFAGSASMRATPTRRPRRMIDTVMAMRVFDLYKELVQSPGWRKAQEYSIAEQLDIAPKLGREVSADIVWKRRNSFVGRDRILRLLAYHLEAQTIRQALTSQREDHTQTSGASDSQDM